MQLLRFILIGLIAGWMMGRIRDPKKGFGPMKSLLVGAIGSCIGWFLMGFLKVQSPNLLAQVAMAVMGAAVLFLVIGLFSKKKKKKSEDEE